MANFLEFARDPNRGFLPTRRLSNKTREKIIQQGVDLDTLDQLVLNAYFYAVDTGDRTALTFTGYITHTTQNLSLMLSISDDYGMCNAGDEPIEIAVQRSKLMAYAQYMTDIPMTDWSLPHFTLWWSEQVEPNNSM